MLRPGNTVDRKCRTNSGELITFNPQIQHYGTFFSGFAWQLFGCLTFRDPTTSAAAKGRFRSYIRRLRKLLGETPVSCIAVLEHRHSGCGHPPTPYHWHFVMATKANMRENLLAEAPVLWREDYGNCKIEAYDRSQPGAFYLAKLVGSDNFDFEMIDLHRMSYHGPHDLFHYAQTDPYIPDHVRHRLYGETLRLDSPNLANGKSSRTLRGSLFASRGKEQSHGR